MEKLPIKTKRLQTNGEEIANAISHGLMSLAGIFLLIYMLLKSHNTFQIVGAVIFPISLILCYTISCLYHSLPRNRAKFQVFKRFDHCSIYLLIAGTYTPILINIPYFISQSTFIPHVSLGVLIIVIQWLIVIIGVTFKAIFNHKLHWIHLVLYVLLGWTALFFINHIFNFNHIFFTLVLLGGFSYTGGVAFYVFSKKVYYFHFVWHIFTILGTILHIIAILIYLYN